MPVRLLAALGVLASTLYFVGRLPTAASALPRCPAETFQARAQMEACAGSLCGRVILTHRNGTSCLLEGHPGISLWHGGARLHVKVGEVSNRAARTQYGLSVGSLRMERGNKAQVVLQWAHWCRRPINAPVHLRISFPGNAGTLNTNTGTTNPRQVVTPPCYGNPREPSAIDVWPFARYPQ
jgi:Protein of unknown function (DUF4232)